MNTSQLSIKVKLVSPLMKKQISMPSYATPGAAAMDLHACCTEPICIPAQGSGKIPTGIAIELPNAELVALIFPRSGLASKYGISLSNAVGVIDSDYRGEIICLMKNDGVEDFLVYPGDRIAQIGFFPVQHVSLVEVEELGETQRGEGGFGSTGVSQVK